MSASDIIEIALLGGIVIMAYFIFLGPHKDKTNNDIDNLTAMIFPPQKAFPQPVSHVVVDPHTGKVLHH